MLPELLSRGVHYMADPRVCGFRNPDASPFSLLQGCSELAAPARSLRIRHESALRTRCEVGWSG